MAKIMCVYGHLSITIIKCNIAKFNLMYTQIAPQTSQQLPNPNSLCQLKLPQHCKKYRLYCILCHTL